MKVNLSQLYGRGRRFGLRIKTDNMRRRVRRRLSPLGTVSQADIKRADTFRGVSFGRKKAPRLILFLIENGYHVVAEDFRMPAAEEENSA